MFIKMLHTSSFELLCITLCIRALGIFLVVELGRLVDLSFLFGFGSIDFPFTLF